MFQLDAVVPWGRSFDEYRRMFALSEADLTRHILGCADGPASFNAEARRAGVRVVSCDPIYQWPPAAIQSRIDATYEIILAETRAHAEQFTWTTIPSVEELGRVRMAAMRTCLQDLQDPRAAGRYLAAALPHLPFAARSFDIALCSHFLFLYSEQLPETFHRDAVEELCRVATEVRIFPLLALDGQRSRYVDPVRDAMIALGRHVSFDAVPYEFQRGGHQMMRIVTR